MWLLDLCRSHRTFSACHGMTYRSFNKLAAVHRNADERVFVQTGLAQRGLGFGWRLHPKGEEHIRRYYELMPLSLGCVVLKCDVATLRKRNVERGKDRSHMLEAIAPSLEIAAAVLRERGPLLEIDTRQPIEVSREQLGTFVASCRLAADTEAA